MKSESHSQQLKWSMGALKKGGGWVNITTPGAATKTVLNRRRSNNNPAPSGSWKFAKG